MVKPILTAQIKPPEYPRAVFFRSRSDRKEGEAYFEEVTRQIDRLEIEPVENDAEGAHWLRRLNADGQQVWRTRHPSLQETLWHAEWEYEIKEGDWNKEGV